MKHRKSSSLIKKHSQGHTVITSLDRAVLFIKLESEDTKIKIIIHGVICMEVIVRKGRGRKTFKVNGKHSGHQS